MITFFEH